MLEFFNIVQQVIMLFGQYMSIPAVIVGVGAILLVQYLAPAPEGATKFATTPGNWVSRLLPLIGPCIAMVVCIAIEWYVPHAELGGKSGLIPNDYVRGINSGIGSEFLLRVYFKTFAGK